MKRAVALVVLAALHPVSAQTPTSSLLFTVTKDTPLRSAPRLTSDVVASLSTGKTVALDAQTSNGLFFHVSIDGKTGWTDGRYLVPLIPAAEKAKLRASNAMIVGDLGSSAEALIAAHMPPCGSPSHYRWPAKIAGTQQPTPTPVTVAEVLKSWTQPEIPVGHSLAAWCYPRTPEEEGTFALTGVITRIRQAEGDGDWHVELIAPCGAVADCVVAEIPDPTFGAKYKFARDRRLSLLQAHGSTITKSSGDLSKQVSVTVVGDAFFDGWHIDGSGHPSAHGRCNSSTKALWEIHPVFEVR